jgi:hypothetical protein
MGIAYSPPDRVIHADIDASSSHCLRQGLHRAVLSAGWEIDRVTENGYVYILTSPQDASLQMKVGIQDTGRAIYPFFDSGVIDIVFMDVEEENASQVYVIRHGNRFSYGQPKRRVRAHITPCQIFTYVAGIPNPGNHVMGGIPFVDPNALVSTAEGCADEVNGLKTTRAWWSCGDLSPGDYMHAAATFRAGWYAGCNATLHNSAFMSEPAGGQLLTLPILQRPEDFWSQYGNANFTYPVMLRWLKTEEPLCFDPLLAWSGEHPVKVRGQFWDAMWRTKYAPWESPLTFEDLLWFSYSNGDRQMTGSSPHIYSTGDIFTLYLRDPGLTMFECDVPEPEVPTESNYAY